jgi:hypothetical protein
MNIFEFLFFFLALFVSYWGWKVLFPIIGWWGVFPAVVVGFSLVAMLLIGVRKLAERNSRES